MMRLALWLVCTGCAFGIEETVPDTLDRDHDGVADARDNCPGINNPDQADGNSNGVGDACAFWCDGQCSDPTTCDCEDFDDGNQLPDDWTFDMFGGGMAVINSEEGTSGNPVDHVSRSLRISALGSPTGQSFTQKSLLTRAFTTAQRRISLEVNWKLFPYLRRDLWTTFTFMTVAIGGNGGSRIGLFNSFDDVNADPIDRWGVFVTVGGQTFTIAMPPPVSPTKWARIGFDVEFADSPTGHVAVTFDGVEVFRLDDIQTTMIAPGPTQLTADLGANMSSALDGSTGDVNMYYDDAVVRVE